MAEEQTGTSKDVRAWKRGAAARTQARGGRKGTQTSGAGGEREKDAVPAGNVGLGGKGWRWSD